MTPPSRAAIAATTALLLLAACAGDGTPESSAAAQRPAPRDPAVVDVVGADELLDPKGTGPNPLPSLFEVWAELGGLDPQDGRLVYTFTGNGGGLGLFCRLRGPLTDAELAQDVAGLSPDEAAYATVDYARRNLAYLHDASLALLTRRPTPDEAQACRDAGVGYAEVALGEAVCPGEPCPALALVKPERLGNPLLRRLLEVVAEEPGLLADAPALALAGVRPLPEPQAERTRVRARVLLDQAGPPEG